LLPKCYASSRRIQQPNSVAAFDETGKQIAIVFETAPPFDTPRLMTEVVGWAREELESRQLHPLRVNEAHHVLCIFGDSCKGTEDDIYLGVSVPNCGCGEKTFPLRLSCPRQCVAMVVGHLRTVLI
jgi:hypothetical protein